MSNSSFGNVGDLNLAESTAINAGSLPSKSFSKDLYINKPPSCARDSIMITPGTTGLFGKWPLKKKESSLNLIEPDISLPGFRVRTLSTKRKGSLWA